MMIRNLDTPTPPTPGTPWN